MEVKGIALKTTRDYVKANFPKDYSNWFKELPDSSKEMYEGVIDMTKWYPIKEAYLIPISKITQLFFNGDGEKCGDTIGYYSADVALKGLYKVFLMIATPAFLMQKASKIISTYYQPTQVEAISISPKSACIKILQFDAMDQALEYRFGGWCKRALELSNCKGVSYKIDKSIAKGDSCTEIVYSWE